LAHRFVCVFAAERSSPLVMASVLAAFPVLWSTTTSENRIALGRVDRKLQLAVFDLEFRRNGFARVRAGGQALSRDTFATATAFASSA